MTGIEEQKGSSPRRSSGDRPLRVLAVHRYYWPDTPPYAAMLRRIVGRWHQQDGHRVEVLSSQPSYKAEVDNRSRPRTEAIDGVTVRRLALPNETARPLVRVLNALRLCGAVLWRSLVGRYDVIMISTVPPVVGGLTAALAARLTRSRFIYHCMDIHPDVGRISGEFSHPLVFRLLSGLDAWSCRQADPVVVLSRDMENTLRQRPGGDQLRIKVLNNFSLPSEGEIPGELPFEMGNGKLTVLFAGNIGRFQGLDAVIEAMAKIRDREDVEFLLMGEGAARASLQEKAERLGARVRFVGHHPVEVAKAAMARADLGFVSLVPGVYRYAYPSKTMTYLEQGCPLIVAVEPESQLAAEVEERHFGYCVPVGDSDSLANLLTRLADQRGRVDALREAAWRQSREEFAESVVLDAWTKILDPERGGQA